MIDRPSSQRPYGYALLALSLIVFAFLSAEHARVPMWVEGMPEYEAQLSAMLGVRDEILPCALHLGSFQLPLAVAPYVGGGFIYLHAPFVAAWFHGFVGDPYFYRFVGILAFLLDGWLIFFIASRAWNRRAGLWAGAIWLTTPDLLLISIADLQFELIPLVFLLGASAFFLQFVRGTRIRHLLAAAFLLGVTATTRIDPLILLLIAFVGWLAIFKPARITQSFADAFRQKKSIVLAIPFLFALGAWPFILYNALCPSGRIFLFFSSKVFGRTFGAGAPSMAARLATRASQYFSTNALHQMPFLSVTAPNYLFAIAWAAAVIAVLAGRRRDVGFPLFAIVVLVPVSLLSTGVLRPEHMISFQVLTSMLVASALTRESAADSSIVARRITKAGPALLTAALLGNILVLGLDWIRWERQSVNEDAITNQSAPVLLADYLKRSSAEDRILFTNIGLWPYMDYLSAGRMQGEDVVSWNGTDDFVNAVEGALRDKHRRRIFVAVSPARDGGRFNFVRTRVLYELLAKHRVPYTRVRLSSPRRRDIYDIITVPKGWGTDQKSPSSIGIYRSEQALFALAFGRQPNYADVQFQFGQRGDIPLAGDWTGRGITTVGVYRPSSSTFYLRNVNAAGKADIVMRFGQRGDLPVVGDWDGNSTWTVGVFRPADMTFYLRNSNAPGPPETIIRSGPGGGVPIAGDWNGDGVTSVGTFDPATATFRLRNRNTSGPPDLVITFGRPGDLPIVGDWNGSGVDTIGTYRPADGTFFLRYANGPGPADRTIPFGIASDLPLTGHWNG